LIVLCPNCHRLAHDGTIDKKSLRKYKEIFRKLSDPPVRHESNTVRAFIQFNLNTTTGILDANNISSFTDHGIRNFSFCFIEPFEDDTYVINAIGDGSVTFKVVEKRADDMQIVFGDPCPNIVRLEFRY